MDIGRIVYGIIAIVVAVLIIATVLIPTVDGLSLENNTYKTLLGVTVTLTIIVPVMMAVRLMNGRSD